MKGTKAKIISLALTAISLTVSANIVHADEYYSTQPSSGYTSGEQPQHHRHHHNKLSINVGIPDFRKPVWVRANSATPLSRHAVVSGHQPNPPATLYVCHGFYRGGVHPGKLYEGRCNIGWGGNEIVLDRYEVLTSKKPLRWVPAEYGHIPSGAIVGGDQRGMPLYICKARYHGGMHSGKVVGENCNFGWGGKEITIPFYKVLVS